MAERRMFSKSVIGSARFLRMPPSSRLLYYDLGMQADDDGVVEAFAVMRTTGATEDDLRVLCSKGFVTVLNDDLVTYIVDWKRNNLIKSDRYHPSIYANLLVKIDDGTQLEPTWNQIGTQMEPEVRLGKFRLGEARTDKERVLSDKPPNSTANCGELPHSATLIQSNPNPTRESFDVFWAAYPRKVGKDAARKAFLKVKADLQTLLIAIDHQRDSEQWKRENGRYIPNPATWLNQGRWQDELPADEQKTRRKSWVEIAEEMDREGL